MKPVGCPNNGPPPPTAEKPKKKKKKNFAEMLQKSQNGWNLVQKISANIAKTVSNSPKKCPFAKKGDFLESVEAFEVDFCLRKFYPNHKTPPKNKPPPWT